MCRNLHAPKKVRFIKPECNVPLASFSPIELKQSPFSLLVQFVWAGLKTNSRAPKAEQTMVPWYGSFVERKQVDRYAD